MCEFESLDRCAAYVAARTALEAVHGATWPADVAEQAKRAAIEAVMATAESLHHDHASPARRRCVRTALVRAIELVAAVDVAQALGTELDDVQRTAGRSVAMLGLLLHSSANPFPEDECGLGDTRL
ncbi:MAG: hypothetical protein JWO36_4611 [Myxococcales bacterium]|nr:hypothetical protein [Myxococcales bacterium]